MTRHRTRTPPRATLQPPTRPRATLKHASRHTSARSDAPQLRIVRGATQGGAGSEATIYLYDEIGCWGVGAADFVQQLNALDVETIHLHVNSPGGDVFDGVAMYNALLEHPATIITHVDGLAASIASVIALAGDEVVMAENAFFMIHNAWTIAMGNADDFRALAGVLDKIDGMVTATYVKNATADAAQVKAWMAEETWFDAQEAVDAGFATEIAGASDPEDAADTDAEEALAAFDLSVFAHAPAALTRIAASAPTGAPTGAPTIRHLERSLRDAGLSRSDAKAFAALGSKALSTQRDAGDDVPISTITASLQSLLATLRSSHLTGQAS